MKLAEIREMMFVLSGQFILESEDYLNLSIRQFKIIFDRALITYYKYRPIVREFNIVVHGEGRHLLSPAPLWVSRVTPMHTGSVDKNLQILMSGMTSKNFFWKYEEPYLYLPYAHAVDIKACFRSTVLEVKDDKDQIIDYDYVDLKEDDDVIINLALAQYLIVIGSSRKSFQVNDTNFQLDGSEMVSRGEEILRTTEELLRDNSKWYLAVG